VVVAVVPVGVVQVVVHQVIGMVAVRHGLVSAMGAMLVTGGVAAAIMRRRAARGVGAVRGDVVFFHPAGADVVEVAVMEVVEMPLMDHRGMAAAGAVLVRMVRVVRRTGHRLSSFLGIFGAG
jgi:hypothetical protein